MRRDLTLVISWFPTAMPTGPAIGDPERMMWGNFADVFWWRREGGKDGPAFIPARFQLEPDGKHVRRLGANLIARTLVVLDCETNKQTGEVPPSFDAALARVRGTGWATILHTSHSHTASAPRYRIGLQLSEEIDYELPAVEVVASRLGLAGVIDQSKCPPASLFYLPSCKAGELDCHQTVTLDGVAIDAAWLREAAGKLLAERQAEQDRIAAAARAAAEEGRQARIVAGFDPDDSLIEKVRSHLPDLEQILLAHHYDKRRTKFRHPNSTSGAFGADIKTFAGIERTYSHNANDPLHRDNLPAWCGGVTALDAFDATVILDFSGDRKRALRELAERFGLSKPQARKAIAKLIFRLIRQRATQQRIETAALAEGNRLGLSAAEVIEVAQWVASRREAA
jgi:hypothetical protein